MNVSYSIVYSITWYDLATNILMTWDQVQFRNNFILVWLILYGAHSLNIHDIISRTSNTLFLIRKPTYGSRIKKFRTNFCPPLISTNIDVFTTQHYFCQLMSEDNNFMNSHKLQMAEKQSYGLPNNCISYLKISSPINLPKKHIPKLTNFFVGEVRTRN